MPLLQRNKLRAEITFGAASFIAGQTLHGTVKLRVLEPLQLRALRATHIVVEHVRPMTKRESKMTTVESTKIVFDKKAHESQVFLLGTQSPAGQVYPLMPGEYSYPFAIEIPATVPPSMGLTQLGERRIGALVQHTIRVDANISNALLNYHESFPVRVVNACPAEKYCSTRPMTVDQHAPAHNFMKVCPSFANTFPSATYASEQAEFRINLQRPIVSLADDGFLAFQVMGLVPCRYEVRLHRTCTVQIKKKAKSFESVVASTVMPALHSHGVADGAIPLDAHKLRGLTNMQGQRLASVQHHVSVHLLYDRGVFVDVDDKLRAKVPVVLVPAIYHGAGAAAPHGAAAVHAVSPLMMEAPTKGYGATHSEVPVMGQVLQSPACVTCSA